MQSVGNIMATVAKLLYIIDMKKIKLIIIFALIVFSCQQRQESYPLASDTLRPDNIITVADIETINLDSAIATSCVGKLDITNGKLCFIDYMYCFMYFIDETGKLIKRDLGIGNGPNEINCGAIATHTFFEDGSVSFYGTSDDVYIYTNEYVQNKERSFRIRRDFSKMDESIEADPDSFETYSFPRFMVCRAWNGKSYINNSSTSYGFNYFETPDKYSQNCRILTEYDIPNKKIGRLLGKGMPEIYHGTSEKNYIFSEFTFDIDDNGNFYIAFLADDHIYKFDKDFKPLAAFGYKGNSMDMEYLSITNPQEIYAKAEEQYKSKGWYTWVEYIPEKNWVCRSYHKGAYAGTDGLQIYDENNVLTADIDVPVGFKPVGYIYPYLYSDIVERDGKLVFYKIRVE